MIAAESGFIHRFVAPAEPDPKITLLLLHGTGADEEDLIPLGHQLVPGAALLSPRGGCSNTACPDFFAGSPKASSTLMI